MSEKLAADTGMGAVTLNVADLDAMTAYYRDAVGLDVIGTTGGGFGTGARTTLGRGGRAVVILEHSPALKHAGPRAAGLFHTAILFDTEAALAAAVYGVARAHPQSFTGSSDHLVSKAFYFDDPEHNGVELYWDRDRTQWSWTHGRLEMSTLYLDPNAFLQEHLTEEGMAGPLRAVDTKVGHVHLSVGDVDVARDFYVGKLGFDETTSYPGATFVSAGGYHHHMAMNVWNSSGAGRRQQSLGLGRVDILVPSADAVGELVERMRFHGIETRDDGREVAFEDPWANAIRVTASV